MNPIEVSGMTAPTVCISPSALALRDHTIRESQAVTRVASSFDLEVAASTMQDLKRLIKAAEEARKEIKDPVLTLAKLIDSTARDYTTALEGEIDRVGKLVSAYTEAQRRAAAEAERLRQAQLARIERDRIEAEDCARKAAQAAAAAAALAATPEASEVAQVAAQQATMQLDAIAVRAAQQTARVFLAPVPIVIKPQGVSVASSWTFDVVSLQDLYRARPDLVVLQPSVRLINDAIKGGVQIPGLRVYQETKVGVRV